MYYDHIEEYPFSRMAHEKTCSHALQIGFPGVKLHQRLACTILCPWDEHLTKGGKGCKKEQKEKSSRNAPQQWPQLTPLAALN